MAATELGRRIAELQVVRTQADGLAKCKLRNAFRKMLANRHSCSGGYYGSQRKPQNHCSTDGHGSGKLKVQSVERGNGGPKRRGRSGISKLLCQACASDGLVQERDKGLGCYFVALATGMAVMPTTGGIDGIVGRPVSG